MKEVLFALCSMTVAVIAAIALSGCQQQEKTGEKVGDYAISVSTDPNPPVVGQNRLVATISAADEPLSGAIVHIHYSMPAMAGMPAMGSEVHAKETNAGRYAADVDFSAGGKFPWDVRLEIANDKGIIATSLWKVTPEIRGVQFVSGKAEKEPSADAKIDYYTCTMHPSVKQKDPGTCPICAMDLVPVYKPGSGSDEVAQERGKPIVNIPLYQQQLIGVQFDTVRVTQARRSIRTVGIVAADERKLVTVNLKFSGWIEKLYADYDGKKVRRGEPLFEIYSPELVATQEEFLQSLHNMTRGTALSGADSRKELQREGSYARNAEARLRLWGITQEQIEELAQRGSPQDALRFYSPIDGFILKKNIIEGSMARTGTDLLTIADLSTVWIYADVYEYELPFIDVGQETRVTLSSDASARYSGRIDYIYPVLEKKARTAKIRIVVPNPMMKLKPEMYADVELIGKQTGELTVAETSVLDTGTRQLVFVYRGNGRFEPREVAVGAKTGDRFVVLDGLETGDVVVKSGNFLIDAEAHVQGVLQSM